MGEMHCTRCGNPATTKRDDAFYCGACSLGLDWQELIQLLQDTPVEGADRVQPIARSA
jgi:hypothetical protein